MAEIKIETGHGGDGYECSGCGNDKIELGLSFCQECDEQTEKRNKMIPEWILVEEAQVEEKKVL